MPIYEYQCGACAAAVEKLQKLSDPPLVDCPECGKPELRKLVSAAGFRLKGGGWYETDFKSGSKKNLVESGDAKGNGAKETSKETKPGDAKTGATKPAVEKASKPAKKSSDATA